MYYTLSQLKTRINSLIDSQGDDSTCAAFIYTKEDVVQYDDEGDEIDLSTLEILGKTTNKGATTNKSQKDSSTKKNKRNTPTTKKMHNQNYRT